MTEPAAVAWGGLHNARDLGGLPGRDRDDARGRAASTARRASTGSTTRGWAELVDAGVRTIVDLRNPHEITPLPLPAAVTRHHRPIEVWEDRDFMARWGDVLNSPAYYRANLDAWPRPASSTSCGRVADAPPGGVVVHCAAGRDRTGLVTRCCCSRRRAPTDAIARLPDQPW